MALDKERLQEESAIRYLLQIILSWQYFRLYPREETAYGSTLGLAKVKTKSNLILAEAKSQIIKEKEDEVVIQNLSSFCLISTILHIFGHFYIRFFSVDNYC